MNFRDGKTRDQAPSRGLGGEDFLVWHSETREMLGEKFWEKKNSRQARLLVSLKARGEKSRASLLYPVAIPIEFIRLL